MTRSTGIAGSGMVGRDFLGLERGCGGGALLVDVIFVKYASSASRSTLVSDRNEHESDRKSSHL